MLPRLQPPKGRPPPQKLRLNTQIVTEPGVSDFASDVRAATHPTHRRSESSNTANASVAQEVSTLAEPRDAGMSAQQWYEAWRRGFVQTTGEIGEGSGGTVRLCQLTVSEQEAAGSEHLVFWQRFSQQVPVFALKEIPANPDVSVRKQVLRELQFNRSCVSPYIVNYYGAFLVEECGQIFIAMEFCNGGSLDAVLRRVSRANGRIGERVLACIASSVLEGITYLYGQKIIHRDIKPQNILLTSRGEVKLCDFGVSGEVVDSLVTTFTGTSYYMAPERIRGQPYTVTSDVWSLGLTLMELAMNRFPFDTAGLGLTPIELLTQIVKSPSPTLPEENGIHWSSSFRHFLKCCLEKESDKRPSPQKMLSHPWIKGHRARPFDMGAFVRDVNEKTVDDAFINEKK